LQLKKDRITTDLIDGMRANNYILLTPIIICSILSITALECYNSKDLPPNRQSGIIKSIKFRSSLPVLITDSQLYNFSDSFLIYYHEDHILYARPLTYTEAKVFTDKNDSLIREELVKTEIRWQYFVYTKGNLSGLRYDSLTVKNGIEFPVDSFLAKTIFFKEKMFFDKNNDSLVQKIIEQDNTVIEKYISKTKPDETYCDTTFLYFKNGFKGIDFHLSKYLDSLKNLRLFKARLFYNPKNLKSNNPVERQSKELVFEIKENPVFRHNEIMSYFERYKKDFYKQ
jgi:hypothetical protein